MCDTRSGCFIYQAARVEALELEGLGELVVFAGGQDMRHGPTADGNGFEATRTPPTVEIQPRDRRGAENGTRIRDEIYGTSPLAQQSQTTERGKQVKSARDDLLRDRKASPLRV